MDVRNIFRARKIDVHNILSVIEMHFGNCTVISNFSNNMGNNLGNNMGNNMGIVWAFGGSISASGTRPE